MAIDPGQRYGKLVVLERAGTYHYRSGSNAQWHCRCDCGKETVVHAKNLRSGNTRSCGCGQLDGWRRARERSRRRFIGERIGSVDVLRVRSHNWRNEWYCHCSKCGRCWWRSSDSLARGLGCPECDRKLKRDLAGRRFGRWTVLRRAQRLTRSESVRWLCRCNCGTERSVHGNNLLSGKTKSCGCYSSDRMKEWHRQRKRKTKAA